MTSATPAQRKSSRRWLLIVALLLAPAVALYWSHARSLRSAAHSESMMAALSTLDIVRVAALLNQGADPNHPLPDGRLPLSYAVQLGEPSLLRLLLEKGADRARLLELERIKLQEIVDLPDAGKRLVNAADLVLPGESPRPSGK